ncbi:MAG: hypothetical protein AAF548_11970 [Actinomycetota bacterium]
MSPTTDTTTPESVTGILDVWAQESTAGLMAHRVVIDRLLDLRNLLSSDQRVLVDAILVDLPGRTVVQSTWWHERVADLRLLLIDEG